MCSKLIFSQALLTARSSPDYRYLFDAVGAIFFAGTIHNEQHDQFEKSCKRCLTIDLDLPSEDSLCKAYKSQETTTAMKRVCADFRMIKPDYRIFNFYEKRSTKLDTGWRTSERLVSLHTNTRTTVC